MTHLTSYLAEYTNTEAKIVLLGGHGQCASQHSYFCRQNICVEFEH